MKSTAIVTDSNSSITPPLAKELGIYMVPMPICVNGQQYLEGKEYTPEQFFAALREGAEVSTSQPAPGEVIYLWQTLLREYESVVYLPMSSGLSSSCQTAKAMALDFPGRVYVVDNKRISASQYAAVLDALELVERGVPAADICRILEEESLNASIYISVNTLELLKKSGRVTAAGAAMATVLNLKPVLQIQGSKLDAFKKARGMQKAKEIMIDACRRDVAGRFAGVKKMLFVAYSGELSLGEAWQREAQAAFPDMTVHMVALPLSICCHVGEGALGIGCVERL